MPSTCPLNVKKLLSENIGFSVESEKAVLPAMLVLFLG